jgi:hypothetical protein
MLPNKRLRLHVLHQPGVLLPVRLGLVNGRCWLWRQQDLLRCRAPLSMLHDMQGEHGRGVQVPRRGKSVALGLTRHSAVSLCARFPHRPPMLFASFVRSCCACVKTCVCPLCYVLQLENEVMQRENLHFGCAFVEKDDASAQMTGVSSAEMQRS